MTRPEFRHTPAAPTVHASHPRQRYFLKQPIDVRAPQVSLVRMADKDRATIEIESTSWSADGSIVATGTVRHHMSADELLTLARACVDAAHDLQTNPAPPAPNAA